MEAFEDRVEFGENRGKSVRKSAGNPVGGEEKEEKKSSKGEVVEGEGFVESESPLIPNFV